MKGVFFEGKHKMVVKDDFPKPKIKEDEVLVKVKYCGICGSDVESYITAGLETPGIIIGHEFSGEIVEVGEKVKGWKLGDKVSANPAIPCGKCYWCEHNLENMCKWTSSIGTSFNGAMAEYINVKAERLIKLPDSVSLKEAAALEPLAVALYAVQASGFKVGKNVTIIGAGTIGLLTLQILNAAGASDIYVIEPVEAKKSLALKLGASKVYPPEKANKINRDTDKVGPDFIFDCVGVPESFMTSLNLAKRGGEITVIGIHVEFFEMKGFMSLMLKNLTMRGVYGYTQDNFKEALKLITKQKIDLNAIITRVVSLENVPAVFDELSKYHNDIKVLVEI
ncbi:MAG: alcohol dehydrogenase catalytic domain-containing protein [Candidatus Lokiarchaeota archaeon]